MGGVGLRKVIVLILIIIFFSISNVFADSAPTSSYVRLHNGNNDIYFVVDTIHNGVYVRGDVLYFYYTYRYDANWGNTNYVVSGNDSLKYYSIDKHYLVSASVVIRDADTGVVYYQPPTFLVRALNAIYDTITGFIDRILLSLHLKADLDVAGGLLHASLESRPVGSQDESDYISVTNYDGRVTYDTTNNEYNFQLIDNSNSVVVYEQSVTISQYESNDNSMPITIPATILPQQPGQYRMRITEPGSGGGGSSAPIGQVEYIIPEVVGQVSITNLTDGQTLDCVPAVNISNTRDGVFYLYVNGLIVYTISDVGQFVVGPAENHIVSGVNVIQIRDSGGVLLQQISITVQGIIEPPPDDPPAISPIEHMRQLIQIMITGFDSLISALGDMPRVMFAFMAGMPAGLSTLMITGMAVFLFVAIYNAVRGR